MRYEPRTAQTVTRAAADAENRRWLLARAASMEGGEGKLEDTRATTEPLSVEVVA